ncbi:PilN domain-containing protein [Comamonas piscis]|uniref:PilN domain-containing protein n=1 Tax=Comamonas piscis TaxID=1562974 RepID=A0A7G5EML0_9BURK|nr:PilN domain-containing protein [Comamonas piscis]QMV75235.1 PilN domain-containing protein [Comamonas piscis]WSO33726.1 PilN domain-containing protein [Comamonas piscis]
MILINLLPHREAARKKRKESFQASMVAAALVGALACGAVYMFYQYKIDLQAGRNALLTREIKALDVKIADVAKIDAEIAALKARQKAVEDLQSDRNLPVHLLNELVLQLPDGVYIESLKQQEQTVQIQGIAQSNERVSELLNSLATKTPWLSKPELVEVVGTTTQINAKERKRVAGFNLRFGLVRSSDVEQQANNAQGLKK